MSQKPYFRLLGKCPACNKAILDPFSRTSGPVPYFHHSGKRSCRLIVTPDPHGGDAHSVQIVPHNTRVEAFLESVMQRAA